MSIYETQQEEQSGQERAVERIRQRYAQALRAINQAVGDTNAAVARHGRSALSSVIQAQGDSAADMVAVFNALAACSATITGEDPVALDETA
jgi:cytochrome c-type biogenesis protein CcmH/NrfF